MLYAALAVTLVNTYSIVQIELRAKCPRILSTLLPQITIPSDPQMSLIGCCTAPKSNVIPGMRKFESIGCSEIYPRTIVSLSKFLWPTVGITFPWAQDSVNPLMPFAATTPPQRRLTFSAARCSHVSFQNFPHPKFKSKSSQLKQRRLLHNGPNHIS